MTSQTVHDGPSFYDDPEISTYYWERRKRGLGANALIEAPIFSELVGTPNGLNVLDLGCGDAQYGLRLIEQGCESYTGLDGSVNCYEQAKQSLAGTKGRAVFGKIEDVEFEPGTFDLITSRLALHYIEDLTTVFKNAHLWLKEGGRFVLSVEHPVITSCNDSYVEGQIRGAWTVDDYFVPGKRVYDWLNGKVVKYHRSTGDLFQMLREAGFQIDTLHESAPKRELFESEEDYKKWLKVPIFLFFAARKA